MYRVQDFGPSDLLSNDRLGVRRVKVDSMDVSISVPLGYIDGVYGVNKFGKANNGIQQSITDYWPLADSLATQQIWIMPTGARIHTIQSNNANDTVGGTGAGYVAVSYLPSWTEPEKTVVVTGDLFAGVAMTESAVIINRMEVVIQASSTTANAGRIDATAETDGTITAVIMPNVGQTQQVIYGIPSGHCFLLTRYSASLNDNTSGSRIDVELLANTAPDVNTTVFVFKHSFEVQASGTSKTPHTFKPARRFNGPCVLKVSGRASSNDMNGSASLDGYLVEL